MKKGQAQGFGIIALIVISVLIGAIIIGVLTKALDDDEASAIASLPGVEKIHFRISSYTNNTNGTVENSIGVSCSAGIVQVNLGTALNVTLAVNSSQGGVSGGDGIMTCYNTGRVHVFLTGNSTNETTTLFVNYTGKHYGVALNASENVRQGFIVGAGNTSTFFSLGILAVVLVVIAFFVLRGRGGTGDSSMGGGFPRVSMGDITGRFQK